jgi:hypothetical protein
MKRWAGWFVFGSVVTFTVLAHASFTPVTFSPDIVQIAPNEQCRKEPGKLKCRWDGPCNQVGNTCHSCQAGQLWSPAIECYTCPQGTSLKNKNNAWVCE